ncbi:hypothetical protein NUW54_g4411 [Trametes sanguinea]|uniref:Uncharacterized protein n=1 Tax=Trametes sanguinea TaxID=158606 RepID=A0ACC1Q1K2_9APHY|nr:hypothetical protein NUW54_g4411 [Trametes sanguinea]
MSDEMCVLAGSLASFKSGLPQKVQADIHSIPMSVLSVNIAASNVEGVLFGIFFALAIASLCLLVHRRWNEVNAHSIGPGIGWIASLLGMWRSTLFIATLFFIAVITAHWIIGVRRMFDAFMYYDDGRSASDYYSNLRHPLEVARTGLLIVTLLTGDLVLIHRMWIVWNRRFMVAIPTIVTSMCLIASGIGVLYQFSRNSPTTSIFTKKITDWIIGAVASTLVTKVYGTVMIAYRIYSVNKCLKANGLQRGGRSVLVRRYIVFAAHSEETDSDHPSQEILMIFVESSTLSTAWTIFFAIAYASKSSMQSFPTACSPAINGIAFMLITVRVGLGWDLQLGITGPEDHPRTATLAPFQAHPLRTIRFTVTTTVEQETDYALSERARKPSDTVLHISNESQ